MNNPGINAKLLYLDTNRLQEKENINVKDESSSTKPLPLSLPPTLPPQPPSIVQVEVKSKSNPNGKTILFYNHYNVQPEDPIELWNGDPFSGKIEGNYIYGRGSSDDKGELIARIKAVEYYLQNNNRDLPCNVKFIVKGEEEIGSLV